MKNSFHLVINVCFVLTILFLCTSKNLLAQSQTVTIIQGESIAESTDDVLVQAYPNPVTTHLTLESPSNFELETVLIYDADGTLVDEIQLEGNQFPLSAGVNLGNGTYHLLGIGAFFGKVNWGLAITVAIGIIVITGADSGTGG